MPTSKKFCHPGGKETLHFIGVDGDVNHPGGIGRDVIGIIVEILHIVADVWLTGISELSRKDAGSVEPADGDIELTSESIDYHGHYTVAAGGRKHVVERKHTSGLEVVGERADCGKRMRTAQI